jgi:hypothetical protein
MIAFALCAATCSARYAKSMMACGFSTAHEPSFCPWWPMSVVALAIWSLVTGVHVVAWA